MVNNISAKINNGARKFITGMNKENFYAPIILLEGAVVAGRTYQAYKRGGFVEARERVTEESLGSVFWLGGVAGFSALFNIVGKRLLKVKKLNFDTAKDVVRNPFENYIKIIERASKIAVIRGKKNGKEIKPVNIKRLEKVLGNFKAIRMLSSVLLANALIGFIVPKFNQKITQNLLKAKAADQNKTKTQETKTQQKRDSIDNFANKKVNNVSFEGVGGTALLSITNAIESDARLKLLSTDVGTVGGRGINARNKNERTEILFRDIASVYFYLLSKKHINSVLNYIQDGRSTRLDPVSTKQLDDHIRANMTENEYSSEEFKKLMFGEDAKIPTEVQNKFKNGIISLEEFENAIGKDSPFVDVARKMSKLQPKQSIGAILTEAQVQDVFKGGLINNPEFLQSAFVQHTDGASKSSINFVAEADLRAFKTRMTDYLTDIAEHAYSTGEMITEKVLDKARKSNFRKNAFNLGTGFVISAMFLSTFIPKIQYWITRTQTGQNSFPGTEGLEKKA